jgi:hypothetical protein
LGLPRRDGNGDDYWEWRFQPYDLGTAEYYYEALGWDQLSGMDLSVMVGIVGLASML